MTVQSRATLKTYFETGDRPTQANFADLIDSLCHPDDNFQTALVSGTNIKTINGVSLLGSGNITFSGSVPTDANNTLMLSPAVGPSGGAVGISQSWASGNPVAHTALQVSPFSGSGHGPFKIQVELHQNPVTGTYDFGYADGVFGGVGVGPINYRVRETGWRVGGTLESHEIYDVCQHFPGGASGAVNVAAYWPNPRRVGYTYSTFNNGGVEGKIAVDGLRAESDFANPDNPSVGVFGAYWTLSPSYTTGSIDMRMFTAGASEYGGFIVEASESRLYTSNKITIGAGSQFDVNTTSAGSITLQTTGFGITCAAGIGTINVDKAGAGQLFLSNGNSGSTSNTAFTARASSSGDVSFGVTAAAYNAFAPFNDSCGFIANGGKQFSFYNSNAYDWVFYSGDGTERARVLISGGIAIPTFMPASATASGRAGTIAWDNSFLYVCTATNTWKRAAIASW